MWEWAKQQGPAAFLAHNGKAYDTLILMKMVQHEFTKLDHPAPPVIRGNSILQLRVGDICFLDSMMHMKGCLAKLPKTCGFEKEMRKGIIPYAWYSSFEKLNGPTQFLPDKSFYPAGKQNAAFHKWHDEYRKGEQEQVEEYRRKEREYVALHSGEEEELLEEFRKENKEYLGSCNPLAELEAYLKEDVCILAEACADIVSCF